MSIQKISDKRDFLVAKKMDLVGKFEKLAKEAKSVYRMNKYLSLAQSQRKRTSAILSYSESHIDKLYQDEVK